METFSKEGVSYSQLAPAGTMRWIQEAAFESGAQVPGEGQPLRLQDWEPEKTPPGSLK